MGVSGQICGFLGINLEPCLEELCLGFVRRTVLTPIPFLPTPQLLSLGSFVKDCDDFEDAFQQHIMSH